ncbi:MAG: hypothetical protein WDN25_14135 [Acetobacteraceae bacterium]
MVAQQQMQDPRLGAGRLEHLKPRRPRAFGQRRSARQAGHADHPGGDAAGGEARAGLGGLAG